MTNLSLRTLVVSSISVALLASGCDAQPQNAPTTSSASIEELSSRALSRPTAAAGPSSKLLPIDMPTGTVVTNSSATIEIWHAPIPVSELTAYLRERLPIGRPLKNLPWCVEDTGGSKGDISWFWTDGTGYISVTTGDYIAPAQHEASAGSEAVFQVDSKQGTGCINSQGRPLQQSGVSAMPQTSITAVAPPLSGTRDPGVLLACKALLHQPTTAYDGPNQAIQELERVYGLAADRADALVNQLITSGTNDPAHWRPSQTCFDLWHQGAIK